MRPPFIEAAALLGAHGFQAPDPNYRQTIWSRHAMKPAAFALLPRIDKTTVPIVFTGLKAMADHLERQRGDLQGFAMESVEDLHFRWKTQGGGQDVDAPAVPDRGVQIWTTFLESGERDRCLGFAWLNGGDMETLTRALTQAGLRARDRKAAPPAQGGLSGVVADDSPYRSRKARLGIIGHPAAAF